MSFEPSQMDRTNNFIRNRILGRTADPFLDGEKTQGNEILQGNLNRLGQELIQRQKEAQGVIDELINEAAEIKIEEPAKRQAEALAKRVQELKGVQQSINQTFLKNQDILKTEEDHLSKLSAHLKNLESDFKVARYAGFPYQQELYCIGGRATSSISGLPPARTSIPNKNNGI